MALSSNIGNFNYGTYTGKKTGSNDPWENPFRVQWDAAVSQDAQYEAQLKAAIKQREDALFENSLARTKQQIAYKNSLTSLREAEKVAGQSKEEYLARQAGFTGDLSKYRTDTPWMYDPEFRKDFKAQVGSDPKLRMATDEWRQVQEGLQAQYRQVAAAHNELYTALGSGLPTDPDEAQRTFFQESERIRLAREGLGMGALRTQYLKAEEDYKKTDEYKATIAQATGAATGIYTGTYSTTTGATAQYSAKTGQPAYGTISQFVMGEAANILRSTSEAKVGVTGTYENTLAPLQTVGSIEIPSLPGFEGIANVNIDKFRGAAKVATAASSARGFQVRDLLSEAIRQQGNY